MKKWLLIALLPFLLTACKGKKKQLNDDEGITTADLIDFFDEVKLPYTVADSSMEKMKRDSVALSYKSFTALVPDTIFTKQFGKTAHPHLYPIGKIPVKKQATYLLLKAISPSQKVAYVLVFDKDKKFLAGLPILVQDNNPATSQTAFMDNRFSITTNWQRKAADGHVVYKKAAYAFIEGADAFALILTESNETEVKHEVYNPIDTLARKNKLAGDYRQNRLNLVSVRDGKKPGEITFFVHFEKDADGCKGELKGRAKLVSPVKAVYREPGDQCELELKFAGNTVSLKEDGCGSHRDIKCFFDGTYTKKPAPKNNLKNPAKKINPQKKNNAA